MLREMCVPRKAAGELQEAGFDSRGGVGLVAAPRAAEMGEEMEYRNAGLTTVILVVSVETLVVAAWVLVLV
jgi:hypothetical protein